MADALKIKVVQRTKELRLTLPAAAIRCGLPYSTFLSVYYGTRKRPSPEVLQGIGRGLGLTYEELALAAYGIINPHAPEPESPADTVPLEKAAPARSNDAWTTGSKRQRVSTATS